MICNICAINAQQWLIMGLSTKQMSVKKNKKIFKAYHFTKPEGTQWNAYLHQAKLKLAVLLPMSSTTAADMHTGSIFHLA